MKRICLCLCVIFVTASLLYAEDHEVRKWTSEKNSSGKIFSAWGYLKEITDNGRTVILVINGKEKKVDVSRLSQLDKDYLRGIQSSNKAEKTESETSKEGDKFTFFGSELQVLRPVCGIYLGETIQSLSKRMPVQEKEQLLKDKEYLEEYVREYDVKYKDDLFEKITIETIDDRIYSIALHTRDQSAEQMYLIQDALKKKYTEGRGSYTIFHEKAPSSDFPTDITTSVYIDGDIRIQIKIIVTPSVIYRHGKMGEIFRKQKRDERSKKIEDRL